MTSPDTSRDTSPAACLAQAFLLDPDVGLACRILGLYAARGLDVRHVDYRPAGEGDMALAVHVALPASRDDAGISASGDAARELAECLRVLADKVATLVGVVAVCAPDCGVRGPASVLDRSR